MNHHRVIQVLNELMPTIKEAGSPQPVMLKYARDNNLSPAQLEKMGQVFNTAKTLTFLDQSPNRGASFGLLDVPGLVEEYSRWEPTEKAASAPRPVTHNPLRFPGMKPMTRLLDEDIRKSASGNQIEELSQWEKRARKRAADRLQEELDLAEEDWTRTQAQARKWARQQDALADMDPEEGAMDLVFNLGEQWGKAACRWIWGQDTDVTAEQAREKRAWDTGVAQNQSRLEALDWAVTLVEGAQRVGELRKTASSLMRRPQFEEVEAEWLDGKDTGERARARSSAEEPAAEFIRAPKGYAQPELDLEALGLDSVITEPAKSMGKKIDPLSPIRGMRDDISEPPKQHSKQRSVDTERMDTERSLVLARLMQSDPIISEADPDTVQELYNSLQEVSPEYVRDPARLRMALREAVEYGAVPIHTLNELAQYRKTLAEARGREGELSDREYKI
jgi:hypothetical protein